MADPVSAAFAAIGSAIAGATAATATALTSIGVGLGAAKVVATTLFSLNTLLALAGLAVSALVTPDVNSEGSPTEWRPDPDAGIPYVMGRAAFAGRIIHMDEHGDSNRYLTTVNLLSVGPINSLEKLRADRNDVSFSSGAATSPTEYANKMWLTTALGSATQSVGIVPPTLAKDSPGLAGWDTSSILPSLAHTVWTLVQDSKFKSYPTGAPTPLWVMEGTKLYDPRLDSTYPGGSGSHRIDDPSTWAFTKNPGLHALAWSLGRTVTDPNTGDELLIGIGASPSSINFPAFVELANVCDTNGWEVSAVASSRDDKHQVLKAILQAGGARYDSFGGKISCVARTPRSPVVTVTADDTAGPFEIDVNADRLTRRNTIVPRCVQEDHEWAMTPQTPVTDASYVTADGGEIRQGLDFPYVAINASSDNKNQPAELAAYAMLDSRESIIGTVPLKPHMAQIEPGDVFTVDEPGFLLNDVDLICLRRTVDPVNNIVTISFISETDGKHTYALGKTQTPPTPPGLTAPDIYSVDAPATDAFSAAAGTDAQPTIVVSADDTDEANRGFIVEIRTYLDPADGAAWDDADSGWQAVGQYDIETETVIIPGLEPSTEYEVSLSYVSAFGVIGSRRVLVSVTTGDLNATLLGGATRQAFEDADDATNQRIDDAANALVTGSSDLDAALTTERNRINSNVTNTNRRIDSLASSMAGAFAAIRQTQATLVEDGRSIAQTSLRLVSQVEGALATIEADYMTAASTDQAITDFDLSLNTSFEDSVAGTTAISNINSSLSTLSAADIALARRLDSLSARLSSAYAGIEQLSLVMVRDNEALTRQTIRLVSEVEGALAVIEADYMTAATTETALTNFDYSQASQFEDSVAGTTAISNINTSLSTLSAADRAFARRQDEFTARMAAALAAIEQLSEVVTEDNRASARQVLRVAASLGDAQALVEILADALVDRTDPDNPVARALFEVLVEASGSDPAILGLTSGDGNSTALIAAAKVMLANLGAGEDEYLSVLEAMGGEAFFSRPIHIEDGNSPAVKRLIVGPDTDWLLWLGDADKTASTATLANSDFALTAAGEFYLGGSLATNNGLILGQTIEPATQNDEISSDFSFGTSWTQVLKISFDNVALAHAFLFEGTRITTRPTSRGTGAADDEGTINWQISVHPDGDEDIFANGSEVESGAIPITETGVGSGLYWSNGGDVSVWTSGASFYKSIMQPTSSYPKKHWYVLWVRIGSGAASAGYLDGVTIPTRLEATALSPHMAKNPT